MNEVSWILNLLFLLLIIFSLNLSFSYSYLNYSFQSYRKITLFYYFIFF